MNWRDIKDTKGDYEPTIKTDFEFSKEHGTIITISELKRKTSFNQQEIANSLAMLFNYYAEDFKVSISVNNAPPILITNKTKFESLNIEFEWRNNEERNDLSHEYTYEWDSLSLEENASSYLKDKKITGRIITTAKPLKPGLRGIALFARSRLVNLPEFYGNSDSSHFYAYTTGLLNVDFIDKYSGDEDLIATNRQALDWQHSETIELKKAIQNLLTEIQKDWRKKRKEKSDEKDKPKPDFNYEKWLDSLPKDKAETIRKLLANKAEDNNSYSRKDVLEALYGSQDTSGIAPEYAEFHWRYLDDNLRANKDIERLYKQGNYYQALDEAVKLYIENVRYISQSSASNDYGLMGEVFKEKENEGIIQLTSKSTDTEKNIEKGHADFSRGVVAGVRNPLSHKLEEQLKNKGLITKKDCLNILSLISHLMRRLDNRVSPPK